MTSSIETVLPSSSSSASSQSSAGTNSSPRNSQSFVDICASQLPSAPRNGPSTSVPSRGTIAESADHQAHTATTTTAKAPANRKAATLNYQQLLPVGTTPIPVSDIPNFPRELDESLSIANVESFESEKPGTDLPVQAATAFAPGVAATLSKTTSSSDTMTAVPSQYAGASSSDGSNGQSVGEVLPPSSSRPTINSPTVEGAPTESELPTGMSTISAQITMQNDCALLPTKEMTANSIQPLGSSSNQVIAPQFQASGSEPIVIASLTSNSVSTNPSPAGASGLRLDSAEEEQATDNPPASSISMTALPAAPALPAKSTVGTPLPDRKRAREHGAPLPESLNIDELRQTDSSVRTQISSVAKSVYLRDPSLWQSAPLPPGIENTNGTLGAVEIAATKTCPAPPSGISTPQTNSNSAKVSAPKASLDSAPPPSSAASSFVTSKDGQSADSENDSSDGSSRKVLASSLGSPSPASPISPEMAAPGPSGPSVPIVSSQPSEIALPTTKLEGRSFSNASGSSSLPSPAELPTSAAAGPVQMAQIVSRAAQSEMRMSLNTSAFGSVEVRAVVHANDVGVVIGSEKGDLRSLLANDLPGITNALQQHELKLHDVSFHQQGFSFSRDSSQGGQPQPRSFVPKRIVNPASLTEPTSAEPTPVAETRSSRGRGLSVLA